MEFGQARMNMSMSNDEELTNGINANRRVVLARTRTMIGNSFGISKELIKITSVLIGSRSS